MQESMFIPFSLQTFAELLVFAILGIYVWKDAKKRQLLFNTPAWLWGLFVFVGGGIAIAIYWAGNCSKFAQEQTINLENKENQ